MTDLHCVPASLPAADVRRIAVFRALFLGDLLCSVPALRALRRRFPHAEIDLIGLPWAADLARRLPYIDRLLAFPGYPGLGEVEYDADRLRAFLAEARGRRYDLAVQMHGSGVSSNGFVAELGARWTIGYRVGDDRRLTWSLPYTVDQHEIHRWLALLALVGAPADDPAMEFPLSPDEQARAVALVGPQRPIVVIHAGSNDAARRWPTERFAIVADHLAQRHDAQIVLTGTAAEQDLTADIARAMRYPVRDLAGMTDLGVLGALLSLADLVLANDTGPSHLATALGVPSVVLFGPTPPEQWGPLNPARHRVICAPRLVPWAAPAAALHQLPVEPVLAACEEMLAETVCVEKPGLAPGPRYARRSHATA